MARELSSCTVLLEHRGTPVPQGRARHCQYGVYYPPTSVRHREELKAAFLADKEEYENVEFPLQGEVRVVIALSGPRVNSDLDNHAKQVLDAVVDAGVLDDDSCQKVAELLVRRELYVPQGKRWTRVEIEVLPEEGV